MSRWLRLRTVLDRVAAVVLLLPVGPVLAVLQWRIHRADGGPGLIRVPRVGRNGSSFGMWKLRSMRAVEDGGMAGGSELTVADDDRLTPLGRRLRRFRLDELPQLLNVALGDMTLIGPRPEAPEHVDLADDRWIAVLRAAPGIAGAAQVLVGRWEASVLKAGTSGAVYRETILPVKVAIDGWYVRSASPRLDALVLVSLVRMLTGRSVGRLFEVVEASVGELRRVPHV